MGFEPVYESLLQRIMANVDEVDKGHIVDGEPSYCWLWLGKRDKKSGRPLLNMRTSGKHKSYKVYRLLYQIVYDCELVPQQTIDHKCENVACVRPEHMQVVSNKNNAQLGVSRWRLKHEKGYTNGSK